MENRLSRQVLEGHGMEVDREEGIMPSKVLEDCISYHGKENSLITLKLQNRMINAV